mgnify:CR=1 FL=1
MRRLIYLILPALFMCSCMDLENDNPYSQDLHTLKVQLVLPDECVLYVEEGSVAEEYAKAHEVAYEILMPEAGVEETITAKK